MYEPMVETERPVIYDNNTNTGDGGNLSYELYTIWSLLPVVFLLSLSLSVCLSVCLSLSLDLTAKTITIKIYKVLLMLSESSFLCGVTASSVHGKFDKNMFCS
jgi:hypothetical protein